MAPNRYVESAGQPMFTPVTHPELRRLGRKPVQEFLRKREKYLLCVKDAQNAGCKITPNPLRSSVDKDLLQALLSLKIFQNATTIEDLTDEKILDYLKKRDESKSESMSLQELDTSVKASLKINIHEPDAEMRIISLFVDYRNHLRVKKWERLIDESPKTAIQHIVNLLKPSILRSNIEQDIGLNVDDVKKDWLKFYQRVVKRAAEIDEYIPVASECTGKCTNHKNSDRSKKEKHKDDRDQTDALPNKKEKQTAPEKFDKSKSRKGQLPKCLNSDCPGHHYIKDCSDTPEDKKKELLRRYYEEKHNARLARMSTFLHTSSLDSFGSSSTIEDNCLLQLMSHHNQHPDLDYLQGSLLTQ